MDRSKNMTTAQKNLGAIPKKTYANTAAPIYISKDMRSLKTTEYVKTLAIKNNIRSEPTHQQAAKPKIRDPMEKMASIIGIKNIKWCDVRQHHENTFA